MKPEDELAVYRRKIDDIDKQIIELIAARQQQVEGVTRVKARTGMQALQPARFEAVLQRCRQLAVDNNLDPAIIEAIWRILHDYFMKLEEAALKQ